MLHRTNVYLDDQTVRSLKLLAAARGKSMSDLIRDAVDSMLGGPPSNVDWRTEVREILDRVERRGLPDMSAAEITAEVRAVRAERRNQARAKR